jgi:hypothetical protein
MSKNLADYIAYVDEEHFIRKPQSPDNRIVPVGRAPDEVCTKTLGVLCHHLERPRRPIKAYSKYCAASIAFFESKIFGRHPLPSWNGQPFPGRKIDINGSLRRAMPIFMEKFDSGRDPGMNTMEGADAAEFRLVLHLLTLQLQSQVKVALASKNGIRKMN